MRSGSTLKHSAPPGLAGALTHAQTNWVGAPTRTTPFASARGVRDGSGRVRAAASARSRAVNARSDAKCAGCPTSPGSSEATTRQSGSVTK